MHEVTLVEGPRHPSAESLQAAMMASQCMSLQDALDTEFPGDFHFVGYRLRPLHEGLTPLYVRITKRGGDRIDKHSGRPIHRLGADEVREAGYEVETEFLVGDWDREGHAEWPDDGGQAAAEALVDAVQACQDAGYPIWAVYTSRAGLRLIWRLSEPVQVELAEQFLAAIVLDLRKHDLHLDRACLDWTRLFRLPRVERDGVPQWTQSWFHVFQNPKSALQTSALDRKDPHAVRQQIGREFAPNTATRLAGMVPSARRSPSIGPRPVAEEAERLAWREHPDPTPTAYAVFRAIRRNDVEQRLRYGTAPKPSGALGRNSTVVSMAGSLVRASRQVPEATPELLYGMLCPWLSKFEQLPGDENWYDLAWSKIEDFWGREEPEDEGDAPEPAEPQASLFEREQRFREAFRRHSPGISAGLDDEELAVLIAEHSIVGRSPNDCFRLTPSGTYFPVPERWAKCVHALLEDDTFGVEVHDRYRQISDDGKVKIFDDPRMFDKVGHPGHVHEVRYSARKRDALELHYDGRLTLNVQIHQVRGDIEPTFHDYVDLWLRAMFEEAWDSCEKYLQFFTYADRPICALVMSGAARTGKSLLMAAMGSCFTETGAVRNMGSSRFNIDALHCPVWAYDEALPTQINDVKRFDSYLRELTSGGWVPIERKGHDRYPAEMFPRFVFASNNDNMLQRIFGSSDLTSDDQDALAERLLIVNVGSSARAAIDRAKAHYGDEPALLQAVIEHLLWMRDQADFEQADERFMVSGKAANRAHILAAAIRAPDTVFLANVLLKFATTLKEASPGCEGLHNGCMNITSQTFEVACRKLLPRTVKQDFVPVQALRKLLQRYKVSFKEKTSIRRENAIARTRGFQIDLLSLMRAFMPSADLELSISDVFDQHMGQHFNDRWLALKDQHGYL